MSLVLPMTSPSMRSTGMQVWASAPGYASPSVSHRSPRATSFRPILQLPVKSTRTTPPQSRGTSPPHFQQHQQPRKSPASSPCYSPQASPGGTPRQLPLPSGLDGGELQIGGGNFDPTRPPLKTQLASKLGLSANAAVELFPGNPGGLNEGVWTLRDQSHDLVMKMVKGTKTFGMPTEAEKFLKISSEHPSISSDPSVGFPVKIFRCTGPGGQRFELIVMRKVPGTLLSTLIAHMKNDNKLPQLYQIFEQLGRFLADFQARYGNKQHNDFQPSNIFYDRAEGKFALIDVSDMGPKCPIGEADDERFIGSLQILSKCFGQNFYFEGKRHFEAGYRSRKNGRQ